jgi:hypothetical protein
VTLGDGQQARGTGFPETALEHPSAMNDPPKRAEQRVGDPQRIWKDRSFCAASFVMSLLNFIAAMHGLANGTKKN